MSFPFSFWKPPVVAGVTPTAPDAASIIAWYDFGDRFNSKPGGLYHLTETSSPSYTAGPPSYGSSTAGSGPAGAHWTSTTLDNDFNHSGSTTDWSLVVRFRAPSGLANLDWVLTGNSNRTGIRVGSTGLIAGYLGSATSAPSTVTFVSNTWYTIALNSDHALGVTSISVDGAPFIDGSSARDYSSGTFAFGGTTSATKAIDFKYAAFLNRKITGGELAWFNGVDDRLYSDV